MEKATIQKLIEAACKARKKAYAPYSNFWVGAALLGENGKIYSGCNVECASYSVTNCAERTALFSAVADGCHSFIAIAVVGGPENETTLRQLCPPCGVCRQVLSEFCNMNNFIVILAKNEKDYQLFSLQELLPHPFELEKR